MSSRKISEQLNTAKITNHLCNFALARTSVSPTSFYPYKGMTAMILNKLILNEFVRSAMLYGSKTWCLRENEMTILRRIERAMVKAMCGAKRMKKKRTVRGPNGVVGIEGNSGSDGKGKWTEMVRMC